MNPLDKLLNMYYNQRECAEELAIPQTTLSGWIKKGFIPYKNGEFIEQQTLGKIKAYDIYKYAGKARKLMKAGE
jgi:predicted site-specific integrase-resolvase